MSRARHKSRAGGGSVKEVAYNAAGSNVEKEAKERKKGGRVHGEGEMAMKRHDRPMRGRARGGRIGADKAPLSSAAKIKEVIKGEQAEGGNHSD